MGERTVLLQTMGRQEQEAGRARPRRSHVGSNAFSPRVWFNRPRTQTDRAGSGRLRARSPDFPQSRRRNVVGFWLYAATNATLTNRTRHEGQLRLGTSLHILKNTAAGANDIVCPRRHARVCGTGTILARQMTAIATTPATETLAAAVEAATAIMRPLLTRAMCSRRISTCHVAVSVGQCETGIACTRSTAPKAGCLPPSAPFASSRRAISMTAETILETRSAT